MSYTSPSEDGTNLAELGFEGVASGNNQHTESSARPKKRAKRSCDICKNRKTKCVIDGPGPCRYCASIGATCGTSIQPKRRPFYRVSEEEYEARVTLLRYLVPGTDLDLPTMKRMIAEFEKNPPSGGTSTTMQSTNGLVLSSTLSNPHIPDNILRPTQSVVEAEECTIFQEDDGCMIVDSMGKYRYVGADSSLRFNHATHAARKGPRLVDPKESRKLPFYQVSSEVFENTTKLLRRFVSEEELPELTLENIQAVFAKLDNGLPVGPGAVAPKTLIGSNGGLGGVHDAATALQSLKHNGGHVTSLHQQQQRESAETEPSGPQETMELDEHPLLQEELGCMALDSLQKYRYVGVDSSIRWNHAARIALGGPQVPVDPKIVSPLSTGLLPPTTPQSSATSRHPKEMYLPRRQLCMRYVRRFFDQIHSMYWFYSSEQFYAQLDRTLQDGGATASASWMCSLYSIFALGSMRCRDDGYGGGRVGKLSDSREAGDYLTLAKELSSKATDEADVESVRAFGLLSLASHGLCYSISAYLHLGTAVKIGFSLGLHRDVSPKGQDPMERERNRQLWWSIYILDFEVAARWGYPCTIEDSTCYMKYPQASEQNLHHTLEMPSGYQYYSVSLARLRKRISNDCFLEPALIGRRLPIKRVTQSLSALKKWLDGMPSHLHWDSALPPQHRRSVSILNLRYCISVIFITRPFLLFIVARSSAINNVAKRKLYADLSATCIEAAERSCKILERMSEDETFASLTLFDAGCVSGVIWVLILALKLKLSLEHQNMLAFCRDLLNEMERIGWCERLVPEFQARIQESGMLDIAIEPQTHGLEGKTALSHPGNVPLDPQSMGFHQGYVGEDIPFSGGLLDTMDFNFGGSPSLDVYETLDFETRSGLMDMFTDATLSASNLYSFNLEGLNAEPQ